MCSKTVHWYYVGRNRGVLGRIAFPRLFWNIFERWCWSSFQKLLWLLKELSYIHPPVIWVQGHFLSWDCKRKSWKLVLNYYFYNIDIEKKYSTGILAFCGGGARCGVQRAWLACNHTTIEMKMSSFQKCFFLFLGFPGFSFFIIGGSKLFEEVQISAKMMFVRKKEKQGSA